MAQVDFVKFFTKRLWALLAGASFAAILKKSPIKEQKMMKNWLIAAVVGATAFSAVAGDVTGKVKFEGTQPPERPLPLDPNCGLDFKKFNPGKRPTTRFFAVAKDGGLADVLVQIKGLKGGPNAGPLVIDQRGCEYLPYVGAVRAGQEVHVKNSDSVLHNVHPTPKVTGNREYNKAQIPGPMILKFTYHKPEEFLRFKCDVHPWMFSYVSIMDHGYYAVTDANGNFTIKDVPDGTYEITAKHRKMDLKTQKVTVKGGKVVSNITLKL